MKAETVKKVFHEWIFPMAGVFILALLIQRFVFFHVLVPTGSMIPTIGEGDRMLVLREYFPQRLETGDIIVFKVRPDGEEKLYVKRLIGKPGDQIFIREGTVRVNEKALEEPYVVYADDYTGDFTVPEGSYFFMGDNRGNSTDSRYPMIGFIAEKDILARAGLRFWPLDHLGPVR